MGAGTGQAPWKVWGEGCISDTAGSKWKSPVAPQRNGFSAIRKGFLAICLFAHPSPSLNNGGNREDVQGPPAKYLQQLEPLSREGSVEGTHQLGLRCQVLTGPRRRATVVPRRPLDSESSCLQGQPHRGFVGETWSKDCWLSEPQLLHLIPHPPVPHSPSLILQEAGP